MQTIFLQILSRKSLAIGARFAIMMTSMIFMIKTYTMLLQDNIRKIKIIQVLRGFLFAISVTFLIFNHYGLGQTELFVIQAIFAIVVVFGEIPTGFISDKYSRKLSISIGMLLLSLGYMRYWLGAGFWGFAGAEFLLALGFCCVSGSDSSLLHDTLIAMDKGQEFKKHSGQGLGRSSWAQAIGGLIGGLVAGYSLQLPFLMDAIIIFCSFLVCLTLVEPPREKFTSEESDLTQLKSVFHYVRSHPSIGLLMLFSGFIGTITLSMVWFAQPFLSFHDVDPGYFGLYRAASNLTVGLFGIIAHRIEEKIGSKKLMITIILISMITAGVLRRSPILWFLPLFFVYQMVRGGARVIVSDELQLQVRREMSATVMSINSMVFRLCFATFGPLFAVIGDHYSIGTGIGVMGMVMGSLCLIVYTIYWQRHAKHSTQKL